MKLEHIVNARIIKESDLSDLYFGLSNDLAKITVSEYDKYCSGTINIDIGGTESLSFGDIDTVKGILLVVNNNCELTVNSSNVPISLIRHTDTTYPKASFFMNALISDFSIKALTVALSGFYCAWGE
jgi:hypothetical protein